MEANSCKTPLAFIFFIKIDGPSQTKIEKWDVFEIKLKGKKEGNPFKEVMLSAIILFAFTMVLFFYDCSKPYISHLSVQSYPFDIEN